MTVVLICWTPLSFLFLISLRLNCGLSACGPETLCTAALIKKQNPNLFSPEESLFPKMPPVQLDSIFEKGPTFAQWRQHSTLAKVGR